MVEDATYISHLLAALAVAFSVAPAHGWMQAAAHRLFASSNLLDVDRILVKASHIFQEVSTEENLLTQFASLIKESFGSREFVLLRQNSSWNFQQFYPVEKVEKRRTLSLKSSILELLERDHEPFTTDTLERMRPTNTVTGARDELSRLDAAVALGVFLRKDLRAVLLLGPKISGRIYDLREQRALQMLCDQLAVAQENSNLYTVVQNSKIYNETLVDSLASGIVAVDADRTVTVFNQRAQKLTGLKETAVIGRFMTVLPPPLVKSIRGIFSTGAAFRDRDMEIGKGDDAIPLRVSGSLFHSHTGERIGALLVFNDMTVLKKMEEQIRRTDRLSSIGTLSAGMAHEIKNPLVTIKTFTQLLPKQYNDTDFRGTFSELVGQEVQRIDTIVNRLLNFSRPAKACLKPVSFHEVIDNSLRLVDQQLVQHEITLDRHLDAKRHIVEADAEQLNQTLINFFLNAVHAMGRKGTLSVRTFNVRMEQETTPQMDGIRMGEYIQLDVADTGCGVSPEKLSKIFDPFFTTKEDGVGLGLSVSHGIILEHNGMIDVESEIGKGTIFHVQLPLLNSQEKES